MDLLAAINFVAEDPAYERGTVDGAVHSMREVWTVDEVATFTPQELATAYRIVLMASAEEIDTALATLITAV